MDELYFPEPLTDHSIKAKCHSFGVWHTFKQRACFPIKQVLIKGELAVLTTLLKY
jgi:hypothetical protein